MTLSPYLCGLVDTCCPPDDRARPVLRERRTEDDVEPEAKIVKPRFVRLAKFVRPTPLRDAVVADVAANPASSASDVYRRLRARGEATNQQCVNRALNTLEGEGLVEHCKIKTRRDFDRCGAWFLWTAVESPGGSDEHTSQGKSRTSH